MNEPSCLVTWIEHLHILTSFRQSLLSCFNRYPPFPFGWSATCYRCAPKGFGCRTLDRTLRSLAHRRLVRMRFPLYPKWLLCSGRGDLSCSCHCPLCIWCIWPFYLANLEPWDRMRRDCKFHVGMWLPNDIRSDYVRFQTPMVSADWSSIVCRQVSLWRVMFWFKEITPDAADYLLEILTVEPDEDRLLKHRSTSIRSCLTLGGVTFPAIGVGVSNYSRSQKQEVWYM